MGRNSIQHTAVSLGVFNHSFHSDLSGDYKIPDLAVPLQHFGHILYFSYYAFLADLIVEIGVVAVLIIIESKILIGNVLYGLLREYNLGDEHFLLLVVADGDLLILVKHLVFSRKNLLGTACKILDGILFSMVFLLVFDKQILKFGDFLLELYPRGSALELGGLLLPFHVQMW